MRKIVLTLFGLLTSLFLFAQKPVISGYLGKINYASIKLNTGIRTNHPEQWKRHDQVSNADFSRFSLKSELELNYGHIFSNNFVLEILGGHNSTSLDLNYFDDPFLDRKPGGYSNYHNFYGYPKIVDWYTGVGAKFYRRKKGSLAPLGVYTRLGLNYHTYGIHFDNILADYTEYATQKYTSKLFDFGKHSYRYIEYNGSIGITRAFTDHLIYDVGMTLGWGFAGAGFYDHEDLPNEDYFEYQLLDMLQTYNLIKMYGSISYMF